MVPADSTPSQPAVNLLQDPYELTYMNQGLWQHHVLTVQKQCWNSQAVTSPQQSHSS